MIGDDEEDGIVPVIGLAGQIDKAAERIVRVLDCCFPWPIRAFANPIFGYVKGFMVAGSEDETKERLFPGIAEKLMSTAEQILI